MWATRLTFDVELIRCRDKHFNAPNTTTKHFNSDYTDKTNTLISIHDCSTFCNCHSEPWIIMFNLGLFSVFCWFPSCLHTTGEFPMGVGHRVENEWGLTKEAVVLLNGLIW